MYQHPAKRRLRSLERRNPSKNAMMFRPMRCMHASKKRTGDMREVSGHASPAFSVVSAVCPWFWQGLVLFIVEVVVPYDTVVP